MAGTQELYQKHFSEIFTDSQVNLSRYALIRSVSHLYRRYERQAMARVDANP